MDPDIYKFYGGYSDGQTNTIAQEVERDMRIVQEQINAYSNDPTQAFEAHDLPSLRHGSPGLKFTVSVSPIWGSGGGTSWDDIPQPISYIEGKTRIAGLQFYGEGYVDRILTTYETAEGKRWTTQHGGGGGNPSPQLQLGHGEFITAAHGAGSRYVLTNWA